MYLAKYALQSPKHLLEREQMECRNNMHLQNIDEPFHLYEALADFSERPVNAKIRKQYRRTNLVNVPICSSTMLRALSLM